MRSFIVRSGLVEDVEYAIKDAEEALQAAFSMRDWAGVKKYADQLIKFDRQKYDQDREKEKNTPGTAAHAMVGFSNIYTHKNKK